MVCDFPWEVEASRTSITFWGTLLPLDNSDDEISLERSLIHAWNKMESALIGEEMHEYETSTALIDLLDQLPPNDSNDTPLETEVHKRVLREHVNIILNALNGRERRVIELRFGLIDGHPRSRAECGRKFGMTARRISQIEAQALNKLRESSLCKGLRDFL
jgi:RNA polymerase sigma factor (sigma-70 family)